MASRTKIYLGLMITSLLLCLSCCSATIYKVGDSDGWTTKEDTYYHWVELKEFHVGDSLVFEYDPNSNNDVTQVYGALEYEFCDSASPKAVYKTGHDVVTLTEPGFTNFISSNYSNCKSGQRLGILVIEDPSSSPIPPPQTNDNLSLGKTYTVGDSKGWRVYNSEYYHKWSAAKQFHVGDNLIFEYNEEFNNVLEISGDLEFEYCDTTSPISVHQSGNDLVRLTKPGVHYFISSGHCQSGLKLRVVVDAPIPVYPPNMSPFQRLMRWLGITKPHPH